MALSLTRIACPLALLAIAFSGAAAADVDARLTGKTVRVMNGPGSEFPLRIEAIAGKVKMGPHEDSDRVLYTRDKNHVTAVHAFTTLVSSGKPVTLNLMEVARGGRSLDQMGANASGGVRLLLVPSDALFVDRLKATGRKRTVDATPRPISAEVYTVAWRDRSGRNRSSEALLSRDPAALEFTVALNTMVDALEGVMAGDNGQAVYGLLSDLERGGLGILSFEDCFSVSFLDTQVRYDPAQFTVAGIAGGSTATSSTAQAARRSNGNGSSNTALPDIFGLGGEQAQRQQERIEDKVNDRVDQTTDQAVDSVLDRALDKLFGN